MFPKNVMQSGHSKKDIYNFICKISKNSYKKKLLNLINPYEQNVSPKQIANMISKITTKNQTVSKRFIDL